MPDRLALFDLIDRKLDFTDARHRVITRNIANADTPGYIPEDAVEPDFRRLVAGAGHEPVHLAAADRGDARRAQALGQRRQPRDRGRQAALQLR